MKIKKILKYYLFGESVKEMEMNRILDKVSGKSKLSDREKRLILLGLEKVFGGVGQVGRFITFFIIKFVCIMHKIHLKT